MTADFEKVSIVCALAGAADNNTKTFVFAQQLSLLLAIRLEKKTDIGFRVKFNVEFTRQAAIEFFCSILQKCLGPLLSNNGL